MLSLSPFFVIMIPCKTNVGRQYLPIESELLRVRNSCQHTLCPLTLRNRPPIKMKLAVFATLFATAAAWTVPQNVQQVRISWPESERVMKADRMVSDWYLCDAYLLYLLLDIVFS